ncbi:integrase [Nonomuraea longicatena]|uniref:Protein phosphatase 2C domain-containing protein n=1 Tax=Nonomuraea longicatena TaxID=83682 RepID=A0ABN1R2L6_9ACTN
MRVQIVSEPGSPTRANEDLAMAQPNRLLVLDGLTERTESGCVHGVVWYVNALGGAIMRQSDSLTLREVLGAAINDTADLHSSTCDLSHPGTPAAAVGLVQLVDHRLSYLILGDVTVVLRAGDKADVVTDDRLLRVNEALHSAVPVPPGADSSERQAGLIRRKHAELAVRNKEGGYWVAAADADVAGQAVTGSRDSAEIRQLAVLTDGASRVVEPFGLTDWWGLMDTLAAEGPDAVVGRVRAAEASDPIGHRWPRNKPSDDATVVYWER